MLIGQVVNVLISFLPQEQTLWPLILPYLTLVDISVLSQVSNLIKRIVNRYILTESTDLAIDGKFLETYPVQRNGAMYSKFGDVKGLSLTQVAEIDIGPLVSCFGNLQRFTMRRVTITDGISGLPRNLLDLKLINVKIEEDLLTKFIAGMKETLINLHLDRVQTFFVFGSEDNLGWRTWDCKLKLDLEVMCPNLKSLVFLGEVVWLNGTGVKLTSLKIVAKELQADIYEFMYLEYFYLDVLKSVNRPVLRKNDIKNMTRLRSLTLKFWWTPLLESLEYLDYLRILHRVDPRYKNYIDNLKIKSIHVEYYDYATEPNFILKVLNNDCLLRIIRYLSLEDCLSFSRTNRRVHGLVKEHRFPVMDVCKTKFWHLLADDTNTWILKHFAPSLKVLRISSGCIYRIIPQCTSLTKLELSACCSGYDKKDFTFLPTVLESFSIKNSHYNNWMFIGPYIRRLRNVKEIKIESCPVGFAIDLIRNNLNTLEHFYINGYDVERWESVWDKLSLAKNLKHLTLDIGKKLTINEAKILKYAFSKIGKKLQRITLLNANKDDFNTIIKIKSLQKVEELRVFVPKGNEHEENSLRKMKEFNWLQPSEVSESIVSGAIDLIEALPKFLRLYIPCLKTNILSGIKTDNQLQNYGDKVRFY